MGNTPVSIAQKTSLNNTNKQYSRRLGIHTLRKQYLKIQEVIPKGEKIPYKFQEQHEAATAETERWEKEMSVKTQRELQKK